MRVGITSQSSSVCKVPLSVAARGCLSFMNITPCPMNTSSSIVTPSQTKDFSVLQRKDLFLYYHLSCIRTDL
jgi:hypothetical protein